MKVFTMTMFCVKKTSFAKTAVSCLKMSELEIFLWLTQAPNTLMQIYRNTGATIKASKKTAHDKTFGGGGKRDIFPPKKWQHHQKKCYSPKSVYWYQCCRYLQESCSSLAKQNLLGQWTWLWLNLSIFRLYTLQEGISY